MQARRRTLRFKIAAVLLGLVFAFLIAETISAIYFASSGRGYEGLRQGLAGELTFSNFRVGKQNSIGQPYLLYVPAPNYVDGTNYHNEQGYRGKAVSMNRTAGVSRILCLGGSTTYGGEIEDADKSYPAQLERILEKDLPKGLRGIEVINGGLDYATTAELLTHYHFKFHYFRPDLVIINTGGNDAVVAGSAYYQPDYSNFRNPVQQVQPLSRFGRMLVKSRFLAWIVILTIYGKTPENQWIERPYNLPPPTVWHPAAKVSGLAKFISDDELAFFHNLETLIDEIQKDGAEVLLVPFRLVPGSEERYAIESVLNWTERNERTLEKIATQRYLTLAPFPAHVISTRNWVDHCHLNPDGCREKAEYLATYARKLLWQSEDSVDQTTGRGR